MKKELALYILKILKDYENDDYNDDAYFVELLLANQEKVENLLTLENWFISNKYNSKTVKNYQLNISDTYEEYDEDEDGNEILLKHDELCLYFIDGNGNKRRVKGYDDFNKIEYNHRSFEEIKEELENIKNECRKYVPANDDFIETRLKKEDLIDYSEKCYKTEGNMYIPKSVVAFNEENNVCVIEWFYNKNSFLLKK